MSRKTTLMQIAEASGVSMSTVDRVLNQRGGVSPAKEARVLEWANKLNLDRVLFRGYLPLLKVAVVMQSPKNPFYIGLRDAFNDIRTLLPDLRIHCALHYVDVTDMTATCARISQIAGSHDALIVACPNDPKLADTLRQLSHRLPVITLVTDLPDSGRIAYVGPDNRQMGRAAGELMGRFIGPAGGQVLLVLGLHRITGHEQREMGFRSVLRERFPACTIVDAVESGEDQTRAGQVVADALLRYPQICGIYNVSAGNSAISRELRSRRLQDRMVLITHELTPERRAMLRDGVIDAIIDQNPRLEAQKAVQVLARHFERSKLEVKLEECTPFNIFIRENCPAAD